MELSIPSRPALSPAAAAEFLAIRELPRPWSWLVPLLEKLQFPVLDPRFACCAVVTRPEGAAADEPEEDLILHKLRQCSDAGIGGLLVRAHGNSSRLADEHMLPCFHEIIPTN